MEALTIARDAQSTVVDDGDVGDERLIPLVIAVICSAEIVLQFVHVGIGTLLHAIALLSILVLQAAPGGPTDRRALIPLALVPLLRVVSLTAPLPGLSVWYWVGIVGLPVLVSAVLAARAAGLTRRATGLVRAPWLPQAAIAALGVPLGLGAWLTGRWQLLPPGISMPETAIVVTLLILFVAVTEEVVFRGVIQGGLRMTYARGAVPLAAVLYGAVYLGSQNVAYAAYMTAVGLLYGFVVARTGSILGVIVSHGLLVVGALIVWPALKITLPG